MKAVVRRARSGTSSPRCNRAIFDGHTYANSAGGDPAVMPQLTYEGLFAFFERFYHPGNAIFVSRGDVPLPEILEKVEEIVGTQPDACGAEPSSPTSRGSTDPVAAQAPIPWGPRAARAAMS